MGKRSFGSQQVKNVRKIGQKGVLTMDNMLSAALREFTGLLEQLVRNLLGHDAQEWGDELKHFLRKEPCWVKPKAEPSYLRLISGDEKIVISVTDGQQTITQVKAVFPAFLDPSFMDFETGVKGQSTKNTPVQVYELARDGMLAQVFGSLKVDLNQLCLTPGQIIRFVSKHFRWLRTDGYATFFLYKMKGEFFVADVDRDSRGLGVLVYPLSADNDWDAERQFRFVIPRL